MRAAGALKIIGDSLDVERTGTAYVVETVLSCCDHIVFGCLNVFFVGRGELFAVYNFFWCLHFCLRIVCW